jgi:hypothetical protein
MIKWTFEQLRNECYVVRPAGALGTCGWIDGKPWQVEYIKGLHKAARRAAFLNEQELNRTKETSNG